MTNKMVCGLIGLGCIWFSSSLFALETNSQNTDTIARDNWLNQLKNIGPQIFCKKLTEDPQNQKKLAAAHIDYDKCMSLLPKSFQHCQDKYYQQIPVALNKDDVAKWGKTLGDCVGFDFALNTYTPSEAQGNNKMTKDLSKEDWLKTLDVIVSARTMCNQMFNDSKMKKSLKKAHVSYEDCLTIIPDSLLRCEHKYKSQIPETLTPTVQKKWYTKIGNCVGKALFINH